MYTRINLEMTATKESLDAKNDPERNVELSSIEQVSLQQLLLADKAERSKMLKELISTTANNQDFYRLCSLWSKAFQCQELYQLGPGLFWQHYPDIRMLLSAKWHQKQQKEHPLEWIPLAKMLSSKNPPMCHMSDKLIDTIKNCNVFAGEYIVLVSVQPIGMSVEHALPPILDVLVRRRTPRDDIGPIPGFRRAIYKCAVCQCTGDGGVPSPDLVREMKHPHFGIPKPLVPCPYCHTTYYCGLEHLLQNKAAHSEECCTKTLQETLQTKLDAFIKKHEEEFAKDNFYDLKQFVQLYGEDVVMKWYRQVNSVQSDYDDRPEDQEDAEEETAIDFNLVPDDVAADMKKMMRKIDREKRQVKAKSKQANGSQNKNETKTKTKTTKVDSDSKSDGVMDMDMDTDVENVESKQSKTRLEKKEIKEKPKTKQEPQTNSKAHTTKQQESTVQVVESKTKISSKPQNVKDDSKTTGKTKKDLHEKPAKASATTPMDIDAKEKVASTNTPRRVSSRAKPEPMLKSTLG